jgi:hypothetical protein
MGKTAVVHRLAAGFLFFFFMVHSVLAEESACTPAQFASAVDDTAAALRNLNTDSEKRLRQKLDKLGRERGWNEKQRNEQTAAVMNDTRLNSFNDEIAILVTRLDTLSGVSGTNVSCERLDELKKVRDRLLTVMGQKSGFMLAGLEDGSNAAVASWPATKPDISASAPRAAEDAPEPRKTPEKSAGTVKTTGQKSARADLPANEPPASAPSSFEERMKDALHSAPAMGEAPSSSWETDVAHSTSAPREARNGVSANAPTEGNLPPPRSLTPDKDAGRLQPQQPQPQPQEPGFAAITEPSGAGALTASPSSVGYTMQEISDAGRGVFGTLSAELGSVINYAFQQYGRPNAYIIGTDGGGAFLAGLRYGKGEMHAKLGGQDIEPQKIYWQGPSLGWDFGASGSKALFLVYNLDDPNNVYRRFTGVEGSAYVVGGVGLTVLSAKGIVIVPIRTGLGLRIGANIGYVKFSERSTWNPF